MPRGVSDARYTAVFKQHVVETMHEEKLSYRETARRFEIRDDKRIAAWERSYLTEGTEGFLIERQGRGSKGRPPKLDKKVESHR